MANLTRTRKYRKILLVAGGVVVFLALAIWLLAKNLNPWAQKKLVEQVDTQSKGVYALQVGQLNLSLLAGTATLDSVQLLPKPEVWEKLQKENPKNASSKLATLHVMQVQVKGIPFYKLLFGGDLGASHISLKDPRLELRSMKKDTTSQPLHETVGQQLRALRLQEISVTNGTFKWHQTASSKQPDLTLAGVQTTVTDLQLDSASFQDASRAFYSKEIDFSVKSGSYVTPEGNYQIKTGAIQANTKDQNISLANLRLVPLRSAAQMSRLAGEAATRFQVQVPAVTLSKVNFHAYYKNGNVAMAAVVVQKPKVQAYKNAKILPAKGEGKLPHDVVRQLPFGLNIRKVRVENLFVRYEELAEKAQRPGYVTGSNIDLTLTNFTNDKNYISRSKPAILKASGLIMGKAAMQATVKMPLLDPAASHSLEGSIGKGYPAILNPMVEPSMLVRVKSGVLQRGYFNVNLTRNTASGVMQLQYDEFQIDLLSKGKEKKQSFGKKIKSFIANKIVLKSESEDDGKAPRKGTISVQRRRERSFLTYWKDCLANGVLSVIGAPM
ncbi:hypothetical protein [Rufibacter sp. LB8]|uniref:hypothetical protein n=1 Tax=Rufibacter sp. LB8 TaxID=2777781 RepID=UPI00178C6FFC|nr:hypothetical protein [Rufibacter sp. LB8]